MQVNWKPNSEKPTEEKFYLTVTDGDIVGEDKQFITLTQFENDEWEEGIVYYWIDLNDIDENNFTKCQDKLPTENKFYIVIAKDSYGIYRTISEFSGEWTFDDEEILAWMEYPEIPNNNKKETLSKLQLIVIISDKLDKDTIVLSDKLKGKVNEPLTVAKYPILSFTNIIQVQNVNYVNFKNKNLAIISEDLAPDLCDFQHDLVSVIQIDTSKNNFDYLKRR